MDAAPRAGGVAEVTIEALGFLGDGLGTCGGARVAVATALPGERWRVRFQGRRNGLWRASPLACLEAAPGRRDPVCPHFGACGGCRLQHLPLEAYAGLKRRRILGALRARKVAHPPLLPTATSPLGSRRRLRLVLADDGRLGFRRANARTPVPVEVCPIALPRLVALLAPLGAALKRLACVGPGDEVEIAQVGATLDLVLRAKRDPDAADRALIADIADALDIGRVALGGDPPEAVVVREAPRIALSGTDVEPPPGAFMQATAEGEAALHAFTSDHAAPGRALDLFAGLGGFAFALEAAGHAAVAVEAGPAMTAAVNRAAKRTGRRVEATARDLHQNPLLPRDLRAFATIVLDPPRSGAEAQCAALAQIGEVAGAARIIYASCDPASFARDAAILIKGGHRLDALLPVDQFLYAAEIELIAAFAPAPGSAKGA